MFEGQMSWQNILQTLGEYLWYLHFTNQFFIWLAFLNNRFHLNYGLFIHLFGFCFLYWQEEVRGMGKVDGKDKREYWVGISTDSISFGYYTYIVVYISEKAMAPHSSTFAWKIPWAEEPGGLQSMGSLGVGHN